MSAESDVIDALDNYIDARFEYKQAAQDNSNYYDPVRDQAFGEMQTAREALRVALRKLNED